MGVPNILMECISSFLHGRCKQVKFGQTKFDWCEIKGGVLHCTMIGVLLVSMHDGRLTTSPLIER